MTSHTDTIATAWADVCSMYKPGQITLALFAFTQIFGFIIPATFYMLIDVVFPNFSKRHKIQPPNRQHSKAEVSHCIKVSLFNNLWPVIVLFTTTYLTDFQWSLFTVTPELPSLTTIAKDFVYGLLAREVIFYYVHRLLHHPKLYPHIHKKHHKYTAPISFAGEYAHPIEHIVANMLPIVLPLALTKAHIVSFTVFMLFELWEAAADHSGYDFLKLPPAEVHDLHHAKFRVNYGAIGLMDWIHGTDVLGWDKPKKV